MHLETVDLNNQKQETSKPDHEGEEELEEEGPDTSGHTNEKLKSVIVAGNNLRGSGMRALCVAVVYCGMYYQVVLIYA